MFVAFVAYPTRAAVPHVRCRVTIVLLVSAQRVRLVFSLTIGRAVWGECSHVFHMHCLLKWIGTPASKQQCPMDRRTWGTFSLQQTTRITETTLVTAERKVPQGQQGQ